MEMNSPPPPPSTVTVRRNPHRKARATPSSHVPLPIPLSSTPPPSSVSKEIPPFPIQDILSVELPQNPKSEISTSTSPLIAEKPITENLKVFLRIRPLAVHSSSGKNKNGDGKSRTKDAWPRNPAAKNASRDKAKKKSALCVTVNDSHSVTLCPPTAMQDVKRIKSEVYEGFSHVFSADSSQDEVFEKMVAPLVDEFLRGKSGMIAALGPSGSGKTHTIFGSPREPGMVPLALRSIFSRIDGNKSQKKRWNRFMHAAFNRQRPKGGGYL
ncbi:Plus-end-directed kinesin ATPase [Bertholletia excelsa]